MRHSSGEAPLLVVPSLGGDDDGVDSTTVSFLLSMSFQTRKEEKKAKDRLSEQLSAAAVHQADRSSSSFSGREGTGEIIGQSFS